MSIYIYSDLFVETFWRREKNKRAHPLYTGVKYTHHLITPQITRAGLTARARTPQNKGEKKPFTIETIAITNVEDEGKIESIHIQYRTLKKRRACLVQIDEKQKYTSKFIRYSCFLLVHSRDSCQHLLDFNAGFLFLEFGK